MNKACCFIGHRKINKTDKLALKLRKLIEYLIVNQNVKIFLFGSKSDFNDLCYSVVTDIKVKYLNIKRICYTCKSEVCTLEKQRKYWEKIYSNFFKQDVCLQSFDEEFEYKNKYVSGKASYIERNYAMIDGSDYCIFYYDKFYQPETRLNSVTHKKYQPKSGTKFAYEYAQRKKKTIFNVID